MIQTLRSQEQRLLQELLSFGQRVAGSCQIQAACLYNAYSSSFAQVLFIINDFQPRMMNYAKVFGASTFSILAVDRWVFERDVDRGFLGEALAGGLIFPYKALLDEDYLHLQEVTLKERLISELLQSLILDFPELSYEFYIKPEYFMYETMLTRVRLYPPMLNYLSGLVRQRESLQKTLAGFSDALKKLEGRGSISLSKGYVRLSKEFIDKSRARKVKFMSLFKTGQRALFTSLLGIFPQVLNMLSQNRELVLKLQKIITEGATTELSIEDPENLVYFMTANGLVPLANKVSIEEFARKALKADKTAEVRIASLGGILNDVYLASVHVDDEDRKVVVKRFRDWSNFKWFPLTLWAVGTKTFAVPGKSRLGRECAINGLLASQGFAVPEILYVSPGERLIFMEYVVGDDLGKIVRKIADSKADSELKEGLELVRKAGELFAKVHALGVALGDTKPENILVDRGGELHLTDLEQAGRSGDKVWDIAEFLYYAGHVISPLADSRRVELVAEAFITGYLQAGGSAKTVKNAATPKYTKVFSVFTFPHMMLTLSNICRNVDTLKPAVAPSKGQPDSHKPDERSSQCERE